MDRRGVFAVARGIWLDPDFAPEPFTEREAFMWLVSDAAWIARKVRGTGKYPVTVARGEFSHSVRFLGDQWRWDKDRAARFLLRLLKRDIITDTSRDGARIFKIKNYNDYQVVGLPERDSEADAESDADATPMRQTCDKLGTLEHSNIQNNISPFPKRARKFASSASFEAFYAAYPKRVARGAAEQAYARALKIATAEQLLAGAQAYAALRAGEDAKFTKAPAVWLNQKCWLDEVAASATGPPNPATEFAKRFAALDQK